MKKILLPTDFSEVALNAIHYALEFYKDQECLFFLLHTYTPPVYHPEYILGSPGQIGLGDVMQEAAETRLKKLKHSLEEKFPNPNHSLRIHAAFSTLVHEIHDRAAQEGVDLVIMGTKGATGAREILFGSNAVHVIKNSNCPVLVIPPGYSYQEPNIILFPTDYEIEYTGELLGPLTEIQKNHKSTVHVLHVSAGPELSARQAALRKLLKAKLGDTAHFHDIADTPLISAINEFKSEKPVNLLAMVRNKHTFVERLFIEPVIKNIGFHVNVPFLILPPDKSFEL
ncbi:Nucleotide-binding universal stress protein, UspA family [Robiginitalea myxolifaciens]|uniref:Nucleotide-binding universal stress protein, UspA family n=1 Tax=Robiginitalea myxolifaciens TaxID=400055 RepID=A0A1I6FTV1_9FLAO|nr:universal stress protein [Robiginitalea myxolifaciens]SFR33324.1 Nucleotide-binding universal stress protein, UspA family [Robiginitalea myxolifaciens]